MTAVWVVRAGDANVLASQVQERSAVAIGWKELSDLSALASKEELAGLVKKGFPTHTPMQQAMSVGQVYRFVKEIGPSDLVLTPIKATRTVLIGRVEGDYLFDPSLFGGDYPHTRKVKWLREVSRDDFGVPARNTLGGLATVFRADAHLSEVEKLAADTGPSRRPPEEEAAPPFVDDVKARADEMIRDLLAQVAGYQFQGLVAALLRAMGYVAKVGPRGKDVGVDLIAHPDPFGFGDPRIKVQVKHRAGQASRPELQALSGALHPGEHGLFVSTGGFTKDAEAWAGQSGKAVTLLDGEAFVELLLENYERLDPGAKALVPLRAVWIPISE
jgi:restriction system protein